MDPALHNSVIRDCILDNRLIDTPRSIRRIIDTPEFQRLRQIRQTGLTSYVFPGSEHSRFSHSVGVYGTAHLFFDHLAERAQIHDLQISPLRFDDSLRADFSIAALVHDIGHTAFSHVLEGDLLPLGLTSHEQCTRLLVTESQTLRDAISNAGDIAAVFQFISNVHPNRALNDLISSTLDVDRCDYILRDSMLAGVKAGIYDLQWLIHALSIDLNEDSLPVLTIDGPRGLDSLRQYLYARRYMYRKVYYHPAIRGAQILIKAIFARLRTTKCTKAELQACPTPLRRVALGERPSLQEFLDTTDTEVFRLISEFAHNHKDSVLRYLCDSFRARRFPKPIMDSEKSHRTLENEYGIELNVKAQVQGSLPLMLGDAVAHHKPKDQFIEELKAVVKDKLKKDGVPEAVADYLVAIDDIKFTTSPPEVQFVYGGKPHSADDLRGTPAGNDIGRLLESFVISRIYVPNSCRQVAIEHLHRKYKLMMGGAH